MKHDIFGAESTKLLFNFCIQSDFKGDIAWVKPWDDYSPGCRLSLKHSAKPHLPDPRELWDEMFIASAVEFEGYCYATIGN